MKAGELSGQKRGAHFGWQLVEHGRIPGKILSMSGTESDSSVPMKSHKSARNLWHFCWIS